MSCKVVVWLHIVELGRLNDALPSEGEGSADRGRSLGRQEHWCEEANATWRLCVCVLQELERKLSTSQSSRCSSVISVSSS